MKYLRLFIYSIFALLLASLSVKASTEDIYSFDDLTPSKTIVNGTKLSVGDSYPTDMRIIYNEYQLKLHQKREIKGLNKEIKDLEKSYTKKIKKSKEKKNLKRRIKKICQLEELYQ